MHTQATELVAAALEALPVAVLLLEPSGQILSRNSAARELLGSGDTVSRVLRCQLADDRVPDWPLEIHSLLHHPGGANYEAVRLETGGGGVRLMDLHLQSLGDGSDSLLLMARDVTARVSMERRLATSERLAAMGKLAAQVAHELNTPLDGILRYLGLAQRVCQEGHTQKTVEYLDQAKQGVSRMARIVAELLTFSRNGARGVEFAPLGSLVDEALRAMSPAMAAASVTVVCDLDEHVDSPVAAALFQVMCNLMKNAADAMSTGGRLVITARCDEGKAVLSFADSGPGVPPELLERIFEPFYSTKTAGRGTGLGLSICRAIAERAGGKIEVANRPEGGAVFTVTVPTFATEGSLRQ
jgi:signal transduction histidine kinase